MCVIPTFCMCLSFQDRKKTVPIKSVADNYEYSPVIVMGLRPNFTCIHNLCKERAYCTLDCNRKEGWVQSKVWNVCKSCVKKWFCVWELVESQPPSHCLSNFKVFQKNVTHWTVSFNAWLTLISFISWNAAIMSNCLLFGILIPLVRLNVISSA